MLDYIERGDHGLRGRDAEVAALVAGWLTEQIDVFLRGKAHRASRSASRRGRGHPGVAAASWRGPPYLGMPGATRAQPSLAPRSAGLRREAFIRTAALRQVWLGHPSGRVDGDDIAGYQDDQDREDDHQCR